MYSVFSVLDHRVVTVQNAYDPSALLNAAAAAPYHGAVHCADGVLETACNSTTAPFYELDVFLPF